MAITAFAPTDMAFETFAAQQNLTVNDLVDSAVIAPLLQYLMVPTAIKVAALQNSEILPTLLSGQNLRMYIPPLATAQSLGIQDFNFVTVNGEEGSALIINQDIQAGQVIEQWYTLSIDVQGYLWNWNRGRFPCPCAYD